MAERDRQYSMPINRDKRSPTGIGGRQFSIRTNERERQFSVRIDEETNLRKVVRTFGDGGRITLADLKTLDPNISSHEKTILENHYRKFNSYFTVGWMEDAIVDYYVDRICNSRPSTVLCFSSLAGQLLGSLELEEKIFSQFESIGLAKYRKVMIPCNPTRHHWILLFVVKSTLTIYILDPSNEDPWDIPPIRRHVEGLMKILYEVTGKQYHYVLPPRAMQTNAMDCGVFVCYYAYRLMFGGKLTYNFDELDLRRKIYNSILDQKN